MKKCSWCNTPKISVECGTRRVVCPNPYCDRLGHVKWEVPYYRMDEIFPRRRLDTHHDEDNPGFEDTIRAIEDFCFSEFP